MPKLTALFILLPLFVFAGEVVFTKKHIKVGDQSIRVELALTQEQQEQGLMNRKFLPDNEGMLFVFEEEQPANFWMKNTLVPLSIGFFDKNKKLFQIEDMEPASPMEVSPPTTKSIKPAKYALEMKKGWFQKRKIRVGTKLAY